MKTLYQKLLLRLGIGQHSFNRELWLNYKRIRKCFVLDIISNIITKGMAKNEVLRLLGPPKNEYIEGILSYSIKSFQNGRTKEALNIYFNGNGTVSHLKIKYRKKTG